MGSAPVRAGVEAGPRANAEVVSALAERYAAQLRQYWPKELATAAWALATVLHGLPVLDNVLDPTLPYPTLPYPKPGI